MDLGKLLLAAGYQYPCCDSVAVSYCFLALAIATAYRQVHFNKSTSSIEAIAPAMNSLFAIPNSAGKAFSIPIVGSLLSASTLRTLERPELAAIKLLQWGLAELQ